MRTGFFLNDVYEDAGFCLLSVLAAASVSFALRLQSSKNKKPESMQLYYASLSRKSLLDSYWMLPTLFFIYTATYDVHRMISSGIGADSHTATMSDLFNAEGGLLLFIGMLCSPLLITALVLSFIIYTLGKAGKTISAYGEIFLSCSLIAWSMICWWIMAHFSDS